MANMLEQRLQKLDDEIAALQPKIDAAREKYGNARKEEEKKFKEILDQLVEEKMALISDRSKLLAQLTAAAASAQTSAAAPAASAAASAGGGVGDQLTEIKRFLRESGTLQPQEQALVRMQTEMPSAFLACRSAAAAKVLYQRAKLLPGTTTRHRLAEDATDIRLDGVFNASNAASSVLVHAWQHGCPKLLKIPIEERPGDNLRAASHEVAVWDALEPEAASHCLAGPLELVLLRSEGQQKQQAGVLLPLYPSTLVQVPNAMKEVDVFKVGTQMREAVHHMHMRGYVHCDVKPANVLITTEGNYKLCDYGSAARFGEPVCSCTTLYIPEGLSHNISHTAIDEGMLLMTLLGQLGLWPQESRLTLADARTKSNTVTNEDLKALLLQLFTAAAVVQ